MSALLERRFELFEMSRRLIDGRYAAYQRNNVCWLRREFMCQFLIVRDEVCDVNVAIVLLN